VIRSQRLIPYVNTSFWWSFFIIWCECFLWNTYICLPKIF